MILYNHLGWNLLVNGNRGLFPPFLYPGTQPFKENCISSRNLHH